MLIVLCAACGLASCGEWTETQSIAIREADVERDDPQLYAQYLADIREYRARDHKIMYVDFDNIAGVPFSRGHHLNAIPDSVDIVSLMNPDEPASWAVSEMDELRRAKGMRFVFTIGYPAVEQAYEKLLQQGDAPDGGFPAFAAAFVDTHLALVEKYGYDGISVLFYGKSTTHLTDPQKEEYLANESAFMSGISAWVEGNPDKLFIFEGSPQNLTDKSGLQRADYIVVRCEALDYASSIDFEVLQTLVDGVPNDRMIIRVSALSLDPDDLKTGYFIGSDLRSEPAIPIAAEWVCAADARFAKRGLAIQDARNDYFTTRGSYQTLRDAISTMNPSPKL